MFLKIISFLIKISNQKNFKIKNQHFLSKIKISILKNAFKIIHLKKIKKIQIEIKIFKREKKYIHNIILLHLIKY